MDLRPDRAIAEENLADGVRLALPPRSTQGVPALTVVAVFLSLFGAVFTVVGVAFVVSSDDLPSLLFGAPFALVGLITSCIGMGVRGSYTAVEITRDSVRVIDRVGVLRRSRRRPRAAIERVFVKELEVQVNHRPVSGFGMAVLEVGSGRSVWAGLLYRIDTLTAFAARLGRVLGLASAEAEIVVEPADRSLGSGIGLITDDPPPGSDAAVERNAAGLVLTVPPTGFVGASRSLLIIGILFAALPVVMLIMVVLAGDAPALAYVVLSVFIAVGLGLVTGSTVMARRHAMVAVLQGSLLIKRFRPFFGVAEHEWAPGDIRDVLVAASNTSVNNRRLMQLRVSGAGGDVNLWTGRDEDELDWMVGLLRQELRLAGEG